MQTTITRQAVVTHTPVLPYTDDPVSLYLDVDGTEGGLVVYLTPAEAEGIEKGQAFTLTMSSDVLPTVDTRAPDGEMEETNR